jgi:excisionase family DNA binding protein
MRKSNAAEKTSTPSESANDPVDLGRLLTVPEVARHLRVGQRTVYRWIQDGKLPVLRLAGSTIRVAARDLEAWLHAASQPVEPGNTPTPQPAPAPVTRRWAIPPASWSERRPTEDER